ncbi:MAG: Gfo/Idh/MocA family oxidoreductase [Pirellulaceae bacterium]|nr:Gfo/Idh/MocA family oxidoreductase [Pirellulaceae bacterium]
MPAKHRVVVIGHTGRGNYGHGIDTVWSRLKDTCEVLAVSDPDESGRAEAAKRLGVSKSFADYRQMLDEMKPTIVGIGPRWVDQHRDMVLACAERGAHMYMEKPLCRCPAEADEMVAACQKHDVKLALAHQTRYSPKLQVLKEFIEAGNLGELLELRGRGKEDARGGSEDLWVLGSHVMNLINFFGGDPKWCFAQVKQDGQPIAKSHIKDGPEGLGPLAGDTVSAMYGMDGGATAYFGSKRNANGGRFGLTIYGSRGVVEILTGTLPSVQFLPDPAWSAGRSGKAWIPISSAGVGKPETLKDSSADAGNHLAVLDLIAAIEQDRDPECSLEEGKTTIEMICAVFESQRTDGPVQWPLKTRVNPLSLL